jgi:hypothetical protein
MIARRVVMSRSPGLAQLGSAWLPLPFMLMLPLVWNEALFSSGPAGSLPSILGHVVAGVYMYRMARLLSCFMLGSLGPRGNALRPPGR